MTRERRKPKRNRWLDPYYPDRSGPDPEDGFFRTKEERDAFWEVVGPLIYGAAMLGLGYLLLSVESVRAFFKYFVVAVIMLVFMARGAFGRN